MSDPTQSGGKRRSRVRSREGGEKRKILGDGQTKKDKNVGNARARVGEFTVAIPNLVGYRQRGSYVLLPEEQPDQSYPHELPAPADQSAECDDEHH